MATTEVDREFGKWLSKVRNRAGLSQAAVAAVLGRVQSTVYKIEVGQRPVSLHEALVLGNLFHEQPPDLSQYAPGKVCPTCYGRPPGGFRCCTCGAGAAGTPSTADPARKLQLDDAMLREVAQIYRENIAGTPTAAVARHFGKRHRTAAMYVRRARAAGHLGESVRGKAHA